MCCRAPEGGGPSAAHRRRQVAHPYPIQAFVPLLTGLLWGETYTIGFYARALEAETADGEGVIGVRFQENAQPWPGFGDATVQVGPEWQWHEVSDTSTVNASRQNSVVTLQLAGAKQTVQIRQTIVVSGAPTILGAQAAPQPAADPLAGLAAQFELPEPLQGAGRLINRPDLPNWGDAGPSGSIAVQDDAAI